MPPDLPLDDLIERFDHVSIGVRDMASTTALLQMVAARFRTGGDYLPGGFRWAQFYLPGTVKLEILQPLEPDDTDNFLVRFLAARGEGVHHMTFKVTDIDAAVTRAHSLGFDLVGVDTSSDVWKEAFVHPRSAHGVVIQLAQWQDGEVPPDRSFGGVIGGLYST